MYLQRQHGHMHWNRALLSGQTKRISFLGDAINLDFISRSTAKEPREREYLGKARSFPSFSTFSVFREVSQPGM